MTLSNNLEDLVVRIAEEFKKRPVLNENGKLPNEYIDFNSFNTPLASFDKILTDDRILKEEPFSLQVSVEGYTEFDSIQIDGRDTISTYEDGVLTIEGIATDKTGEFEIQPLRFGSPYNSNLFVKVVEELWFDYREGEQLPKVINNAGNITHDRRGMSISEGSITEWGEVLFFYHKWKPNTKTVEVVIDIGKKDNDQWMFGIGNSKMNLNVRNVYNEADVLVSVNQSKSLTIYGQKLVQRTPNKLNKGTYRFKFIEDGKIIEIYDINDPKSSLTDGELLFTIQVHKQESVNDLCFMLLVPGSTGDDRIVAYREY